MNKSGSYKSSSESCTLSSDENNNIDLVEKNHNKIAPHSKHGHEHEHEHGHKHGHGHGHGHEHGHGHSGGSKTKKTCLSKSQSLVFMMFLTFIFFLAEIVVGHITHSNSLVADSFHMLSDLISLVIAFVAVLFSKKRSSSRNTFGWARAEILGSLINAVFLLALCFSIVIEALERMFNPHPLEHLNLILIVGGIGLFINLIGLLIFGLLGGHHLHSHGGGGGSHGHSHGGGKNHGHSHKKQFNENDLDSGVVNEGTDLNIVNYQYNISKSEQPPISIQIHNLPVNKKTKASGGGGSHKKKAPSSNMNMHGVFLHILADAFGSVVVIISGLLVKLINPEQTGGWKLYVDPALSLFLSLFIIISTIPLLKESSLILLQTVPSRVDIYGLKENLRRINGILSVHHFHVWSLNSECNVATAHLRLSSKTDNENHKQTIEEVKSLLHNNDIHSTTLQLEYDSSCSDNCINEDCRKKQCCEEQTNILANFDSLNENSTLNYAYNKTYSNKY